MACDISFDRVFREYLKRVVPKDRATSLQDELLLEIARQLGYGAEEIPPNIIMKVVMAMNLKDVDKICDELEKTI